MAIVSRAEIHSILSRTIPRLKKPPKLPTDQRSVRVQQSLAQQAREHLKKLGN